MMAVLVVALVRERAIVRRFGTDPGTQVGAFHDHEDFLVLFHIKVFVIMEKSGFSVSGRDS